MKEPWKKLNRDLERLDALTRNNIAPRRKIRAKIEQRIRELIQEEDLRRGASATPPPTGVLPPSPGTIHNAPAQIKRAASSPKSTQPKGNQ